MYKIHLLFIFQVLPSSSEVSRYPRNIQRSRHGGDSSKHGVRKHEYALRVRLAIILMFWPLIDSLFLTCTNLFFIPIGVAFTRNPATGEKVFYGEYLNNAEGEDVVAGAHNSCMHACMYVVIIYIYIVFISMCMFVCMCYVQCMYYIYNFMFI